MNILLAMIAVAGFAVLAGWYFVTSSAAQVATVLRYGGPLLLVVLGTVLSLTGRVAIGGPLVMFGVALAGRARQRARSAPTPGQQSTVRSAMLEMMLDHDTGDMDGVVLAGKHEGRVLSEMEEHALMELAEEVTGDSESAQLLEAYLDRRMPGWRDGAETNAGAGHAGPAQTGAMTEQEAYQILGLEPGAAAVDIRKAHRSLMQRVHPDVGGSAFLAQRINEAKDFLLRIHDDRS